MKSGPAHGGSFLHRWLSRTSNATSNPANYGDHDVESRSTDCFSPPPLTDSSSTTGSSSTIRTPKTSYIHSPSPSKSSSRFVAVKTPRTPPTRYAALPPPTSTSRKLAVSLPAGTQRPSALVTTCPHIKLHRLLSYDSMRCALIFDIVLPTSYVLQYPPPVSQSAMVVRRQPIPSHAVARPHPIPEYDLSQYATTPPVTRMKIISDLMPWAINVRGRTTIPNDSKSFVRVVDVLETIHHSLRTGVSDNEWNDISKSFRSQVKTAYLRRCRASRPFTITGYEEKQGVRRIDYLCDKTMFLGLMIRTPGGEGNGRVRGSGAGEENTWVMMLDARSN